MGLFLLWLMVGCWPAPVCEKLEEGTERDTCWMDRALAARSDDYETFSRNIQQIDDILVRDAAAMHWVSRNSASMTREQGDQLCGMLESKSRSACIRKFNAVHLQR